MDFDPYRHGVQTLHSRYVRSRKALSTLLQRKYGAGNYDVRMAHNVYWIRASSPLVLADIEEICGGVKDGSFGTGENRGLGCE